MEQVIKSGPTEKSSVQANTFGGALWLKHRKVNVTSANE
jgi:hypothetical protein